MPRSFRPSSPEVATLAEVGCCGELIHEGRREAYCVSPVEEAEREKPRRAGGAGVLRPKAPAGGSDDVAGIHE